MERLALAAGGAGAAASSSAPAPKRRKTSSKKKKSAAPVNLVLVAFERLAALGDEDDDFDADLMQIDGLLQASRVAASPHHERSCRDVAPAAWARSAQPTARCPALSELAHS